ncbi:helix-turn-helix domain-containing protein [Salinisphaera orenii]|uniref:helix-turn-helix domain-containing protein n=1 Tax=Salinisphaera orenii TaxID=856731 RepID=UPI000DBE86A9
MLNRDNLTPPEAAEYLRCSQRTLIRWRNRRAGPAWTYVGGRIIYQRADLDAYLNAKRVEPVAEVSS